MARRTGPPLAFFGTAGYTGAMRTRIIAMGSFVLLLLVAAHAQDERVKELAPAVFVWQGDPNQRQPAKCTW